MIRSSFGWDFAYDYAGEVINGRTHGGAAILWRKALKSTIFYDEGKFIAGLKLSESAYYFVSPYLPNCSSINIDIFRILAL